MKKSTKKLLAIITIMAMLISVIPVSKSIATNPPTMSVSVASETIDPEGTVSVDIMFSGDLSVSNITETLSFDKTKLEVQSTSKTGSVISGAIISNVTASNNQGYVRVTAAYSENTEVHSGKVATVVFKALEGTIGEQALTLTSLVRQLDADENTVNITSQITTTSGTVTIVNNEPVAVTGVSLNKDSTTINQDASETLVATIEPEGATNKNVTWISSNDEVATVENGVVTGVKKGEVTITVKTEDGEYTDDCIVTINCIHKHTTTHEAVASTCLEHGVAEYVTCDDCDEIISGSDEELPLADHDYEFVTRVAPGHNSDLNSTGVKEHYTCTVCHKYFDAETKEEVTLESLTIADTGHDYGNEWQHDATKHWHECGCGNIIDEGNHTGGIATCTSKAVCTVCGEEYGEFDYTNHNGAPTTTKNAKEATCTAKGYTGDIYCTACDHLIEEGSEIPMKEHTYGSLIPEVAPIHSATQSEDGMKAHYVCSECHKYFDEDKNETTEEALIIPVPDHDYGELIAEVPAVHTSTLLQAGTKAHYECSICHELFDENHNHVTAEDLVIPAPTHSYTILKHNETSHWYECSCGAKDTVENHTGGTATCVSKAKCTVCGEEYGEFDYTNHNGAPTTTKNAKEATCTEKGYTGDIYCSACDHLIEEGSDISMKDHDYGDWLSDETFHWKKCNDCENIEYKAEHIPGDPAVENEVPAQIGVEGSYDLVIRCSTCNRILDSEHFTTPALIEYEMTEGTEQTQKREDNNALKFRISGTIDKFIGVSIDGNEIDASYYEAEAVDNSDEVIVTLNPTFLGTLALGNHNVAINYDDGLAQTTFTITQTPSPNTPATGDDFNMTLWISIIVVSGICFVVVTKWHKNAKRKMRRN